MSRLTVLVETDLAQIVRGKDGVSRLRAINLRMCFQRPDDEMIEQMREAIQDVAAALDTATSWVAQQKEIRL